MKNTAIFVTIRLIVTTGDRDADTDVRKGIITYQGRAQRDAGQSAAWSDEAIFDVVRGLPAIERHDPIRHWIIDDIGMAKLRWAFSGGVPSSLFGLRLPCRRFVSGCAAAFSSAFALLPVPSAALSARNFPTLLASSVPHGASHCRVFLPTPRPSLRPLSARGIGRWDADALTAQAPDFRDGE
jgi:hypothetical protein